MVPHLLSDLFQQPQTFLTIISGQYATESNSAYPNDDSSYGSNRGPSLDDNNLNFSKQEGP